MEKKYIEEEKYVKLEKDDLESVTGGIKWGEKTGGKGPRQNHASQDEEDNGIGVSGTLSGYLTGYDKKRGGVI